MAANMYRVGDYVYFETSASAPYHIRRIEELTKTPTGNVEAKVMCFCRRRDVSNTLVNLADKHQSYIDDDEDVASADGSGNSAPAAAAEGDSATAPSSSSSGLTEAQRHQLKHRELFLSRQVETLPATTIRGKCSVTLLNETESLLSYLNREDAFYYTLVYDSSQKTLLADRGEIRVGGRYQAEVQPLLGAGESDGRDSAQLEELVWRPDHGIADADIDKYLLVSRSVGTLARAMDACSSVRQPGLSAAAASASRDVTRARAYRSLHAAGYDLGRAFCSLVSDSGPLLCRDELEEWSAGESNLFEEAMDKYGKDFHDIRQDFLPWKSMKAIVEYFYMWKTTDRHVHQKRLKATEAERKLKQVYIPNYTKPNPAVLYNRQDAGAASRGCESCYANSSGGQWYAWGPPHLSCRLCSACWAYWKRYGGLKSATRLEKAVAAGGAAGAASAASAPTAASVAAAAAATAAAASGVHRCTVAGCDKEFRLRPQLVRHLAAAHSLDEASLGQLSKAKAVKSMLMQANCTTRLARRLCADLLRLRRLARRPFDAGFDAKPALRELPRRFRTATAAGDGDGAAAARQLLLGNASASVRARLTPAQLDAIVGRFCPTLLAQQPRGQSCELLSRDRPTVLAPSPRPRTFQAPDVDRRAEFHRRLDEQRAAAAAAAPALAPSPAQLRQQTGATATSNGGGGGGSLLLPRKRHAVDGGQNGNSNGEGEAAAATHSAAKRPALKAAAAAKYAQSQAAAAAAAAATATTTGSAPLLVANSNGAAADSAAARVAIVGGGVSSVGAAAAAEEIFLFGTKRLRAHLTAAQLRRAGRRPFKPVTVTAAAAASVPNGGNKPAAAVTVLAAVSKAAPSPSAAAAASTMA